MDHGACNVIYLDRRAQDEVVRREHLSNSQAASANNSISSPDGYFNLGKLNGAEVFSNVDSILATFNEVHICSSGSTCLQKLSILHQNPDDRVPTVLLIDVPYDEEQRLKRLSREPRTPSPTAMRRTTTDHPEPDDIYGMHLLTHVSSSIQARTLSRMVIPVVILTGLNKEAASTATSQPTPSVHTSQVSLDAVRWFRYLDAGAVDVVRSPLSKDQVQSLAVHAYRVFREVSKEDSSFLISRKNRKLSWVGVAEAKPYAYLREAMVSGLLSGICNPETVGDSIDPSDIEIQPDRRNLVAQAIGSWSFSAHEFTDDELLYACLLMLEHALQMPELEPWRMSRDELITFLLATRVAYNNFVLYHNFRHVADVLQALFYFLVRIGTLPSYPVDGEPEQAGPCSAIGSLLKPFDGLTLLISAIGHDVGHPGVNNAFLVALNAPLAQLYNDRSVLESFHCAAYSQILRRYWPDAFKDMKMRKLMINSILATDMGLHFRYMADLGNLQERLAHNGHKLDGWSAKVCEEYKELTCGLLIKCADISNVARKFNTAARWASILTDEFSNQGTMEKELEIPTCLFGGPPVQDDMIKMGESQIGFMNIFARPLFEAVMDILPAMKFSVDEILANKEIWEKRITKEKHNLSSEWSGRLAVPDAPNDGVLSPKSGSREDIPHSEVELTSSNNLDSDEATSKPSQSTIKHTRGSASSSSRRFSAGTPAQLALANSSRRSSRDVFTGSERASRRSSGAGIPGASSYTTTENPSSSRRGSADPSVTAFIVTNSQKSPSRSNFNCGPRLRSMSPGQSSGAKMNPQALPPNNTHTESEEDTPAVRPVTAPAPRYSRTPPPRLLGPSQEQMNRFGAHPSQSRSDQNLSQTANGGADRRIQWPLKEGDGGSSPSRVDDASGVSPRSRRMSYLRRDSKSKDGNGVMPNEHKDKSAHLAAMRNNPSNNSNPSEEKAPPPPPRRMGFPKFWKRWKNQNQGDTSKEREGEYDASAAVKKGSV